jgi:uracil-DNA glycosylase
VVREVQRAADDLDRLLGKHDLRRTLRVCAWILRFTRKCRTNEKRQGALSTQEIENARPWWIKRV